MITFWRLIVTAVKVLFLLTPYLIWVKKVSSKTEIKVLDKSFGFSPTPSLINEADLQRDFDDFARKMRCNGTLGKKVNIYLLRFLHICLNLHGIPQKVYQLWNYF